MLLASTSSNCFTGRNCPKNEHWTECDYCSEGNCQEPKMCPVCAGCLHENECVCDDGYLRNKGWFDQTINIIQKIVLFLSIC